MEVAGLAIGVAGLAGLFSTCLDALDKTQKYRSSATDMHLLETQFQAEKLRFQRWGREIGLKRGETPGESHHKALEDEETNRTISEILQIIYTLCQPGDTGSNRAGRSPTDVGLDKHTSGSTKGRSSQRVSSASKKQRVTWALWGRGKREEEVKLFKNLVENLHNLVPPESPDRDATGGQVANAVLTDYSNKTHLLDEVKKFIARRDSERKVELRQNLQSWLLGSYSTNNVYNEAVQNRLAGTCDWITQRPEFSSWLSMESASKLLWINGPAGFGKTVLCASVVQYLTETLTTPVAHFFFSSDFESQTEPFVVIRSWIYHLMLQDTVIFDLVYEAWLEQVDKNAANHVIEKLFEDIVGIKSNCILILDGIDECNSLNALEHTPLHVMRKVAAEWGVRILIVSRNEPDIRHALEDDEGVGCFSEYKITAGDVRGDTESYSRSIVDKRLFSKADDIKSDLSRRMADRCDGQFLWLKMQAGSLRPGLNRVQLQRAITNTPSELAHIYERNWELISSYEPPEMNRAHALLRWAAFSLRPLTIGEITEAVLIEDDSSGIPIEELPDEYDDDYINSEILDLCGSLIEVRKSQEEDSNQAMTVHITHFSVKQYLLQKVSGTAETLGANAKFQVSHEILENTLLAKRCLQYLQFSGMWSSPQQELDNNLGKLFREYASYYWFTHVRSGSEEIISHIINDFLESEQDSWQGWREWFDSKMIQFNKVEEEAMSGQENIGSPNRLCYAANLGLQSSVRHILEGEKCDIDGFGTHRRSPLALSCRLGFTEIARILLEAGASLMAKDMMERTPLHEAARHGHKDIFNMLLEKGADCAVQDKFGWTPLNVASHNGGIELVRIILAKGVDVNTASNRGCTPVMSAAKSGYLEIVKLLLEEGADQRLLSEDGWSPALAAAGSGHLEVLQLLFEQGASVNETTTLGWSLVNIAAEYGHLHVLKFLVDQGADIHLDNDRGWTPLHTATSKGFAEVVQFLVENGANVLVKNYHDSAPLHTAAFEGNLDIVKILVAAGAYLEVEDINKFTPLLNAAGHGHLDVVKFLVEQGANPYTTGFDEWTILHEASQNGHFDVVKYVFENWSDLYTGNDFLWTPLHGASYHNHLDIVQYLVSQAVDINAADESGETPMHKAAELGHFELVKFLLEKGASVAVRCRRHHTPLLCAIRGGDRLELVKLFFENGLDTQTLNDKHCPAPPLFVASANGMLEIAKYLLERGAMIDLTNIQNMTPAFAAACGGHTELLKLLIEKGADIEVPSIDHCTALNIASGYGRLDAAKLLLASGANIDTKNCNGVSPLHSAALEGHSDIVNLLLESGVDMNMETNDVLAPLDMAILKNHKEVAKLLIQKGAVSNVTDNLLIQYVFVEDLDIVQRLVENGADVNMKPTDGWSPVMMASHCGHAHLVSYLLDQGADIQASSSKDGTTALILAAKEGHYAIVKMLVERGADIAAAENDGGTSLHHACRGSHLDMVHFLLDHGADPLARTKEGWTTLGIAAGQADQAIINILVDHGVGVSAGNDDGYTPLHTACSRNQLESAKTLIEKGADLLARSRSNFLPMASAVLSGNLDMLKLLHMHGAALGSRDSQRLAPIHVAAEIGSLPMVRWLLENGEDVSARDERCYTPLHVAAERRHILVMKLLISRGASINAFSNENGTPLHRAASQTVSQALKLLLDAGADPTLTDALGNTPLHLCALSGNLNNMRLLLSHSADLQSKNCRGQTAIHFASNNGHLKAVKFLHSRGLKLSGCASPDSMTPTPLFLAARTSNVELVKYLLDNQEEENYVNAVDDRNYSALHAACFHGHPENVKVLVERGAEIGVEVLDDQSTPITTAIERGHLSIAKFLVSIGADAISSNSRGISSFHSAVGSSGSANPGVLRFLKEHGANVNATTKTGATALLDATATQRLEPVKVLIELGANPNIPDDTGLTPLLCAATKGSLEIARFLLANKADAYHRDSRGRGVLYTSAQAGNLELVKMFLGLGLDVDTRTGINETPLHIASTEGNLEIVQLLLSKGADIHAETDSGETPLYAAVSFNRAKVVGLLIENGAKIDAPNVDGNTPLHLAAVHGSYDTAKVLVENCHPFHQDKAGNSPLHNASACGREAVVILLLDAGAEIDGPESQGNTSLHCASFHGHPQTVKLLLQRGAKVDQRDRRGVTPLLLAAANGNADVIKLLIEEGAAVDERNTIGGTPLHWAASIGHLEATKELLDHGADVTKLDDRGRTSLYHASSSGHLPIVEVLLEHGADPKIQTTHWRTPLHPASAKGHEAVLKALLKDRNAHELAMIGDKISPFHLAASNGRVEVCNLFLLTVGLSPDIVDINGETVLYAAAEAGEINVVELLVANGAKAELADHSGWTPLHAACERGHLKVVNFLLGIPGLEASRLDNTGRSPIFMAACKGHDEVIKLLLERGSSPLLKDFYGSTPLCAALRNGNEDAVALLFAADNYQLDALDFREKTLRWWVDQSTTRLRRIFVDDKEIEVSSSQASSSSYVSGSERVKETMLCDVCMSDHSVRAPYFSCPECDNGNFVICMQCHDDGISCRDTTHTLESKNMHEDDTRSASPASVGGV